jgi:hypothetical protein
MTSKKPPKPENVNAPQLGMEPSGEEMGSPIADVAERISGWGLAGSTAAQSSRTSKNAQGPGAKSGLLTANVSTIGFDRVAYQREYMRIWRKRKKGEAK